MRRDFPCRAADTAFRMVDGEMLVVSASGSNIIGLNETGALVWEMIDGSHSIDEIVTAVCDAFEVESGMARRDVLGFVDELEAAGLIEPLAEVTTA